MARPGPKPKRKNPVQWSSKTAYGVGLMVTDGNLSKDGRHIDFTSQDKEQLNNFKKCFNLDTPISYKTSGYTGKKVSRLQFSDVVLYRFFVDVGMMPAKTKTIGSLDVPDEYFFDFLRGHLDGDGYFYSFWDERWENSFMFYTVFVCSIRHLQWIKQGIGRELRVKGDLQKRGKDSAHQLRYAKSGSLKLLKKIYHKPDIVCLSRKKLKIKSVLGIMGSDF